MIGFMAKGLFGMLEVISMLGSLKPIKHKDMESTSIIMTDLDMKGTGKLMLKKDRVKNSCPTETNTLETIQVG